MDSARWSRGTEHAAGQGPVAGNSPFSTCSGIPGHGLRFPAPGVDGWGCGCYRSRPAVRLRVEPEIKTCTRRSTRSHAAGSDTPGCGGWKPSSRVAILSWRDQPNVEALLPSRLLVKAVLGTQRILPFVPSPARFLFPSVTQIVLLFIYFFFIPFCFGGHSGRFICGDQRTSPSLDPNDTPPPLESLHCF